MRSRILTTLLSSFMLLPAIAQESLQSPSSFLGYELGSTFSRHHQVVDYFNHVARASNRVTTVRYGTTNEGRPLMVAIVSSPSNMARLEEIQKDNLRLANIETGDVTGETLAIVWLSYNVHGDESNSTEASLSTLYALADPGNARSTDWLENTVVILDPAINPDGRDRYANWFNMVVGDEMNVSPAAAEHAQPWPGGRTNHYYFDLNRDWSWQTQIETVSRMKLYKKWMPHIHVDFHEQGYNSPYYFAPAAEPIHEEVTDWQREFETIIGRNHANYFDREGWLYFTKQSFDILYPGYGDSFPMFNGAIGMTYEQAGGGGAGLGIKTAIGDTLTLLDRLTHHTTTGLSTVEMAATHRDRALTEFSSYFDRALSDPPGAYKAYVVRASSNGNRLQEMADNLDMLGISYGKALSDTRVRGLDYRSSTIGRQTITSGDLVIPASQPRAVLTKVLFDPNTVMSDSLTYDITAWALPYAYDVEAVASNDEVDFGPWERSTATSIDHAERPYAYVIRWDDAGDAAFLAALLKQKFVVRYNLRPFTIHGERLAEGSLIVTRRNNERFGEEFESQLAALARAHSQSVMGIATGFVDSGADLGSSDVRYVKAPRVAMPFGRPVSSTGVGEVWYLFDKVLDYPITRFPADRFSTLELDDYDVLVLPSSSFSTMLPEAQLERLSSWIRGGGRLIAIDRAASWLAGKKGFSLKMKEAEKAADSTATEIARAKRYVDRGRDRAPTSNPGAIYRVSVDTSHPLGFGFSKNSFVLRSRGDHPSVMTGTGDWNVGIVEEDGRVSGHTGYKAEERTEGSLAFGVQSMGRGSVVYLMDNPLYRGFWRSGRMLFANALFMVGQ